MSYTCPNYYKLFSYHIKQLLKGDILPSQSGIYSTTVAFYKDTRISNSTFYKLSQPFVKYFPFVQPKLIIPLIWSNAIEGGEME